MRLLPDRRAAYDTLVERAEAHLARGNLGMALVACEVAAQHMPADDTQVYELRGLVLFQIGDHYGALCDLSRALALGTPTAELFLWRGLVYRALGAHHAARADLEQFVRCHPLGAAVAQREIATALDGAGVLAVAAA